MPSEDKNKRSDDIKINVKSSGLAEFTKRNLPSDEEVKKFNEVVEKEFAKNIGREESFDTGVNSEQDEKIEASLNQIYDDDDSDKTDVRRLEKAKRHGLIFKLVVFLLAAGILGAGGYAAYYFFYQQAGADVTALNLSIEGKTEAMSGEEFFYTINYNNNSNLNFNRAKVEINLPENFVFLDSMPTASNDKNNAWEVGAIKAHSGGTIKIKGLLAGEEGKNGIIVANISYNPEGFSSEFKKEASLTTTINGVGLNLNFDFVQSALVGDDNEIDVRFNKQETNYINGFRVTLVPQDNIQILDSAGVQNDKLTKFTTMRPGVWQVDEILDEEKVLPIKFKFISKTAPTQDITLSFEQPVGADKYYQFLEKKISYEVMKNDLNLTLIANGSRNDQGIDFGQTLNCSIVYKNKGETEMKDVVIMAVLESDFLDWTSLKDEKNGREKGNTITWSKEEIPDLADIKQDQEGTIDFNLKLIEISQVNFNSSKDFQVKSYAQFSVGNKDTADKKTSSEDNRSNTIINRINSDLQLAEQVRYFNEDNLTVGDGPLPFQVGQKTSLEVYWTLTNNLHELNDAKVEAILPSYVIWNNKSRTNVGTIEYDQSNNKVTWNIGRLPISVFRADAEFNISVVPTINDRDKIMVIKPGSEVTATDSITGAVLSKKTEAKTSKLEDDDIAQRNNDGIVR